MSLKARKRTLLYGNCKNNIVNDKDDNEIKIKTRTDSGNFQKAILKYL